MSKNRFTDRFKGWKENVQKEYGIDDEHFDLIVEENFAFIAQCIDNPTMPVVSLPKFGTFTPTVGKLSMSVHTTLRWLREKGDSYRKTAQERIKKVWPIRNRLINEKNGEYTSANWAKHFKRSEGRKLIDFKPDLNRYWLNDFPGYSNYTHKDAEKPDYAKKIKPN